MHHHQPQHSQRSGSNRHPNSNPVNSSSLQSTQNQSMPSSFPTPFFHHGNNRSTISAPSSSSKSLFVGDLSFFCTELELVNIFSRFGPIETLEIKRGRHGDSLMHGFLEFVNEADAHRAIQEVSGRKFMGRHIKVNWTNQRIIDQPDASNWIQVHVNFLTPNVTMKVTEEFLESVFLPFGTVPDVSVKRHLCSHQPPQVTGYAFVYFVDVHAALRAIYALKNVPVESVFFECCLSYKAEQMLKELQGMSGVIKRQQTPNPSAFFKRFEKVASQQASHAAASDMAYERGLSASMSLLSTATPSQAARPSPIHTLMLQSTVPVNMAMSHGRIPPSSGHPFKHHASSLSSSSSNRHPHATSNASGYVAASHPMAPMRSGHQSTASDRSLATPVLLNPQQLLQLSKAQSASAVPAASYSFTSPSVPGRDLYHYPPAAPVQGRELYGTAAGSRASSSNSHDAQAPGGMRQYTSLVTHPPVPPAATSSPTASSYYQVRPPEPENRSPRQTMTSAVTPTASWTHNHPSTMLFHRPSSPSLSSTAPIGVVSPRVAAPSSGFSVLPTVAEATSASSSSLFPLDSLSASTVSMDDWQASHVQPPPLPAAATRASSLPPSYLSQRPDLLSPSAHSSFYGQADAKLVDSAPDLTVPVHDVPTPRGVYHQPRPLDHNGADFESLFDEVSIVPPEPGDALCSDEPSTSEATAVSDAA